MMKVIRRGTFTLLPTDEIRVDGWQFSNAPSDVIEQQLSVAIAAIDSCMQAMLEKRREFDQQLHAYRKGKA